MVRAKGISKGREFVPVGSDGQVGHACEAKLNRVFHRFNGFAASLFHATARARAPITTLARPKSV